MTYELPLWVSFKTSSLDLVPKSPTVDLVFRPASSSCHFLHVFLALLASPFLSVSLNNVQENCCLLTACRPGYTPLLIYLLSTQDAEDWIRPLFISPASQPDP